MPLNRTRQKEILEKLASHYPYPCQDVFKEFDYDSELIQFCYLQEHGLIEYHKIGVNPISLYKIKITAKGLDFLEDDGGLSEILGTITIKLHNETIQNLLMSKVIDSDLPEEDKNRLSRQIKTISEEGLKTVTRSLIQQGLNHIPDVVSWLEKFLP
ncbi:hypothetical protein AWQ21_07290 [Picosynechococcus sp. PCC 7003]|nr:hypothetical protein AWQ21_07290 [Picosynechococcus sp. PCC 7003]